MYRILLTAVLVDFVSAGSLQKGERTGEGNLLDDFNDFVALLPMDEITATALDYYNNDEEVKGIVEYMRSPNFAHMAKWMDGEPGKHKILLYMEKHGVRAYHYLNKIHDFFHWDPVYPPPNRRRRAAADLVMEIMALVPFDEVMDLYSRKTADGSDFQGLVDVLKSEEVNEFVLHSVANEEFQRGVQKLRDANLDVDYFAFMLQDLWNWGRTE